MRRSLAVRPLPGPRIERLSQDAFAPFGELVRAPEVPGRSDFSGPLGSRAPQSAPSLFTVRVTPQSMPLSMVMLERHPFSSQTFIPLDVERYLVAVAPTADDLPDLARLKVFTVDGDTGVTYRTGVWHHPMATLDREGTFAVFMWTCGSPEADTEFADFDRPLPVG